MSATGRKKDGAKVERSNGNADSDFCPTPRTCALSLVSLLPILGGQFVIDAGAGEGAFCEAVHTLHGVAPVAVERFPDRYPKLSTLVERGIVSQVIGARFQRVRMARDERPDWIIGNPPFSQAADFVAHALFLAREGGHVAVLLRHGFLVTAGRAEHRRAFPPWRTYDLQTRPRFYGDGSDACEYTWIIYRKGWQGRTTTDVFHWDTDQYPTAAEDDLRRIRAADWPEYGLALTPDETRVGPSYLGVDTGWSWRTATGLEPLCGTFGATS